MVRTALEVFSGDSEGAQEESCSHLGKQSRQQTQRSTMTASSAQQPTEAALWGPDQAWKLTEVCVSMQSQDTGARISMATVPSAKKPSPRRDVPFSGRERISVF